ncbi:hypothetical protein AB9N12_13705 [Bacteroides sp. AN502(2024)]|uniref:hypothetical protein n=1 Tax=Bacteroides sp. AN502(2024) TaxID=3160599 RepID=UPI003517CE51
MKQSSKELLKEGYILLPKAWLKCLVNEKNSEELKALLQILTRANYSEITYKIQMVDIVCQRGESAISLRRWSELFQWSRSKTARFFQTIEKEGLIKIIPHPKNVFHIHIIDYDFWTGTLSPETREANKKKNTESFYLFWDKYHETMQKPKQNIARARREWDKLPQEERQLAIDRIEEVYYHTNDIRFIPLASTYLRDKAFLNEYTN